MLIENITFIQNENPYTYRIGFTYKTAALETGAIPRATIVGDLVPIIKAVAQAHDDARAVTNFDQIKAQYEGTTVDI